MSRVTNLSKLRQERMKEISLRNKERERMREREKAAREREERYSNGHLFTSLTVSGTTLCTACNRSITAKEALSCPTCSVTIHNRCRDTLPHCAKMKQRQQKTVLMRNNSALHNVTLRSKNPGMPERPTSAIYPSDSFRQTLLGSRRGRSSLSLSKSVSTNNIVGNLNDDSPLGLRRILSQSTDSLSFRARALSVESLNDDGDLYYTSIMEALDLQGQDFKADSWSMAVDSSYLHTHRKNDIKRQDVIYELIQTELHHMRTLYIMERVFRQGMLDELQVDPSTVHAMFPCLNHLIRIHSHFLAQLLRRHKSSLQPGSSHNYYIHHLGDILLEQFSGQCADDLQKSYAEFCSRHLKALKLYKELLARDKRFQCFIRMEDLEKMQRLQEIQCKLDPRAEARVRDGGLFKPIELLRRRLVHEGTLLWKTPGSRLKDIQVLLMTDILVFLQEKDQKYIFPSMEKPPVVSLQNLIIRDIANQERGMFLISDSSPPEMYEFHAASKEDKNIWIRHIQFTVSKLLFRCPSREEFPLIETEYKAHLRRLKADLKQKDREILELLQERVSLFCELAEATSGQESLQPPVTRYLFRADTPQAPRAEKLLLDATAEVDRLSELLLGSSVDIPLQCHHKNTDMLETSSKDMFINGARDLCTAKDIYQRLVNLNVYLHALQGAVIKQDTILELLLQETMMPATSGAWRRLWCDGGNREAIVGSTIGELALLQRQHSLLQEELLRLRDAESRFKDSEKARAKLEKQVRHMKIASVEPGRGILTGDDGSEKPFHLSHGFQGGSDVEVDTSDDDGSISESSKDVQDIPGEI
ncbi:rho guanine nucleotide exchange factor 1a isoform X4 [Betta splendens]|uniref:Rho guanine nucleotide exchange factor 1a isoform X4 n=1 Tax=Betta splendens TaxID=158456 RepID=A0A6P7NWP6_BETSP|nr:rho guanine nucleotide exchange factor 1a isoform X4 [Betta splendens]